MECNTKVTLFIAGLATDMHKVYNSLGLISFEVFARFLCPGPIVAMFAIEYMCISNSLMFSVNSSLISLGYESSSSFAVQLRQQADDQNCYRYLPIFGDL